MLHPNGACLQPVHRESRPAPCVWAPPYLQSCLQVALVGSTRFTDGRNQFSASFERLHEVGLIDRTHPMVFDHYIQEVALYFSHHFSAAPSAFNCCTEVLPYILFQSLVPCALYVLFTYGSFLVPFVS